MNNLNLASQNLRFIPYQTQDSFLNMAIDEQLLDKAITTSQGAARLYGWDANTISIGFFQSLNQEVHLDTASELNLSLVRRQTGGGAVVHQHQGELTYSIIIPQSEVASNVVESYLQLCQPIINALNNLGIPAKFSPINDIEVNQQKISGSAQTRRQGWILQHGTILYSLKPELFQALNISKEKLSDKPAKFTKSSNKRITCIKEQNKNISFDQLTEAVKEQLTKTFNLTEQLLSPEELQKAQVLAQEKYASRQWLEQR